MNCIVCGSPDLSLLREIDGSELIQRWQSELGIDISKEIHQETAFKLFLCNSCLVEFFDPLHAGSASLYSQLEAFDWYYQNEKWEYNQALLDLKDCDPVVEIGSGYGFFVNQARKTLNLDIHGIEINPDAVEFAHGKGWQVDQISLEELSKQRPAGYRAVCCFQVLEHVKNPGLFLQTCCDLLAPGGTLILGIPNGNGFQFGLNLILDMPPHHMTIWKPETFQQLTRFFPLDLRKLEFEPLPSYHVELWLRSHLQGLHPRSILYRAIRKIARKMMFTYLHVFPHQQLIQGMGMYVVMVKT